jgi:hypothetical protein|tara:strand:+ start:505 stop:792 length:288 start_codon:yes stop_codon:yes gene_type:complete
MLINVVKTGEIVSLRLSTGEELVGTLREEDKNQITIEQPLIVGRSENGLGLMPYMMTIEQESTVKISTSNIMSIGATMEEVAKGYRKQTSKIVSL